MKILLTIMTLFLMITSCSNNQQEQKTRPVDLNELVEVTEADIELELRKIEDGYKWFPIDDTIPYSGNRTVRYSNFQIKSQETYKDGKLDGTYEEYYQNGKPKRKGSFNNGQKEGLWKIWYKNGQLSSKTTFIHDEKSGVDSSYYENGQLMAVAEYQEGKKNGLFKSWYKSGQKMMISSFENDQEKPDGKYWDENGRPLSIQPDLTSTGTYNVTITD